MLSALRKKQLKNFLKTLNIASNNLEIFDEALTHSSYNFEENRENASDYERLEFLGDSVLRLSISEILFDKYKNYDEGKLTKIRSYLVSDRFLHSIALDYNLNEIINIGPHEEKDGGRSKESILACAMEALFGAIYKTLGFEFAKEFICKIYELKNINTDEILYSYNTKEILQQYTQGKNKDLPEYEIIKETGKAHKKTYEIVVKYRGEELGRGIATTKKDAEKTAAFEAIKRLNLLQGEQNE